MADREELTWELFGSASRERATVIAADGYEPDLILSIARGGLFVAGALGYALDVTPESPTGSSTTAICFV